MPDRPGSKTAREAALAMVARRALSEAQLRDRLGRRGYPPTEIDDALALVGSYGYVDDRALAEAASREAERTGRGPLWLQQTLERRGLAADLVSVATAACAQDADARARAALENRFGSARLSTPKERNRALRFLTSRGFSPECALSVLGAAGEP